MGYTPSPSSGGGSDPALVWAPVTSFGAHVGAFGAPYSAPACAVGEGGVYFDGLLTIAGGAVASGGKLFDLPEASMHPVEKKLLQVADANNVGQMLLLAVMPNGEVLTTAELLAGTDPSLDGRWLPTAH